MELARAPFLRPLMAKHRSHIVNALAATVQKIVLYRRTHAGRGALRTQGQAFAVQLIDKRVHLFLDNIGHLTDSAHKELRALEDRRSNIAIAIIARELAHSVFE